MRLHSNCTSWYCDGNCTHTPGCVWTSCVSLALLCLSCPFLKRMLGFTRAETESFGYFGVESAHLLEIMRALWRLVRAASAGGEEESWRTSASRGACTRHRRRGQETAQLDREQSPLAGQFRARSACRCSVGFFPGCHCKES